MQALESRGYGHVAVSCREELHNGDQQAQWAMSVDEDQAYQASFRLLPFLNCLFRGTRPSAAVAWA